MIDWLTRTKLNCYLSFGVFASLGVVGAILCMGVLLGALLCSAWLLLLLLPTGVITGLSWALVAYLFSIIEEKD